MALEDVIEAFCEAVADLDGIEKVYDHEPEQLLAFPAVTVQFNDVSIEDDETGIDSVTWVMTVNLYVDLRDFAAAQASIIELTPSLLGIVQAEPHLGDADWVRIAGNGPMVFAKNDRDQFIYLYKSFRLEIETRL